MFIPSYRLINFEEFFQHTCLFRPTGLLILSNCFHPTGLLFWGIFQNTVFPWLMSSLEQCPHFFPTYGHNQYIQFQNLQIVFPPKHDKILNVWPLFKEIRYMFIPPYCLVLLCDQNSFGRSKMVLVRPNWFGLNLSDLVTTKMKWSQPKWIGQIQIVIFYHNESHLDLTNSFWSWPKLFWSHRRTRLRQRILQQSDQCQRKEKRIDNALQLIIINHKK